MAPQTLHLAPQPGQLRVHLLGALRLETETAPVRLPTRQTKALLAYLLLHPESHARGKLAGLLWPESPEAEARHSLRVAISALRKQCGDDLLVADPETIQLNSAYPVWVDVREMQDRMQRTRSGLVEPERLLELEVGDLLVDFYDDWIQPEREYYRAQYLDALLGLAQGLRSRSEYARAIPFPREVLLLDPANERAHQQLMFCLFAAGDRSAAVEQFEICRRDLREELGVDPSSETLELLMWIKQTPPERRTRESLKTNLPASVTTFVGRKKELSVCKSLLLDRTPSHPPTRLFTLTGAGGSGKTRLAVQLGTDLLDRFEDGVWWADLAPLADPVLVPQTVARALGIRERPDQPILETLKQFLRSKRLLLLLDNCEHLVAACAELAADLLSACPPLTILATSREALGISGETVWYVPTLSLPDPKGCASVADLNRYEAIQLFVERARTTERDFRLTTQNMASISQICVQLDGIPLAIELAATRLRVLQVEQIVERLGDRFRLLIGGSRAPLPRHRTLRATLDWSFGLLSEPERVVFRRLSVFAGGCRLDSAEAVCEDEKLPRNEILDLIIRLIDKSLLLVQRDGSCSRYRMLETVRQYAAEHLAEANEQLAMQHRHALGFARLAQEAEQAMQGPELSAWIERLEADHDNLRAALAWSLDHEPAETGFQFAGPLGAFWRKRGYLREGRTWLERLLAKGTEAPPRLRAQAMAAAALLARDLGSYGRAIELQAEGLELFRTEGDQFGMADILIQRGMLGIYRNDLALAITCFAESLSLYEAVGFGRGCALARLYLGHAALFNLQWDAQAKAHCEQALDVFTRLNDPTEQAHALIILGTGAHYEGDDDRARHHLEAAVQLCTRAGDRRQLGWSSAVLGLTLRWQGRVEEAFRVCRDALGLALELGEKTIAVNVLIFHSLIALDRGQVERATRLLACALREGRSFGFQLSPHFRTIVNTDLEVMRTTLGPEAFAQAWAEGEAMKLEQAAAGILSPGPQERTGN